MRTRLLATAALAAAAFAPAPASAQPACVGTELTVVVCVIPPRVNPTGSSIDDCVYVVLPECVPVSVPVPTVEDDGDVTCREGGAIFRGLCPRD